jgi:hypothetical protein
MTPREPDRFDAQARELFRAVMDAPLRTDRVGIIAAALRAEHEVTIERAAREAETLAEAPNFAMGGIYALTIIARKIRALIPPAATPAADPIHEAYLAADEYGQPPAPAAETGKAQGQWRVGNHYGIHVYEDQRPVATFHLEEDARRCVAAVNGAAPPEREGK